MRVEHPIARQDAGVVDDAVDVNGRLVAVDDDGTFAIDESDAGWLTRWADGHGYDARELVVKETCDEVKDDGDVCGRDLPCQYHSNTED